jgi:hypothetical protein
MLTPTAGTKVPGYDPGLPSQDGDQLIFLQETIRTVRRRRRTSSSRPEQGQQAETYRLMATNEDEFLSFVERWAAWIARFGGDGRLIKCA